MRRFTLLSLFAVLLMAPIAAFAHTGEGLTADFGHGFVHPLFGIDHLLAMVAVGLFAGQLGGRALGAVPVAFVGIMALGGALGAAHVPLPAVEIAIALSVVVLGGVITFRVKTPVVLAMALVGLFAVFHGHAHGAEMPEMAASLAYGLGFMLATAMLHGVGIGAGFLATRLADSKGSIAIRYAGSATSVAGLALLIGAV